MTPTPPGGSRAPSYDPQAPSYDRRAGLPDGVAAEIAAAVAALAAGAPGGGVGLELGAGTGQIGDRLARRLAERGLGYVGLDLSLAMLARFRRRGPRSAPGRLLVHADAGRPWPLSGGAARAVFASRAIHLLEPARVLEEIFRVAAPGAVFLVGRVRRDPASPPARLAREMRRRLAAHGLEPRDGERSDRRLLAACARRGATVIEPVSVYRWTLDGAPADSIAAWRSKPGLAGVRPDAAVKRRVLEELERWAAAQLGGLERRSRQVLTYALDGVRLPPG